MSENASNPSNFWQELKRRKVVRVITVYAAAAFVILEVVSIIVEPLRLPDWTLPLIIVLLVIGFIISIVLSWVYDITPEGVQKTKSIKEVKKAEKTVTSNSWKIATYVSVLIIVGFAAFYIISNIKESSDISKLEKSIAVLPFENWNSEVEYAHMGDAITDEIILELQKIKEFDRVLSRSSTMQYKENRPTIPEIAEKLGVNYIIEGSIQRHGEDVSIRVQVIRTKNEDHVWADEYNGKWEDIFSIQNEISYNVAKKLKAVLSPEEVEKIDAQPTDNLEAYNLYLKGRFFWHRRTEEELEKSINYFTQAIKLDTAFTLAYAGLADAWFILPWYSQYSKEDSYTKAKMYATKALSINEDNAEAHTTLGGIALWGEQNFKIAEEELKLAIEINPEYDVSHGIYFELLNILKRSEEAEKQINLAIKYNPNFFVYINQRGRLYYEQGRYTEAIKEYKEVLEIRNYRNPLIGIFKCYLKLGKDEQAIEELKAVLAVYDSNNYTELLNETYKASGIEGIIKWLIDWMVITEANLYEIASFYGILGNDEKALEFLEGFLEINPGYLFTNTNPDFDFLRSDPRFISLLSDMNL